MGLRISGAVTIETVPHNQQEYDTVGDWKPGNPLRIRVSDMDPRDVALVAVHEIVEAGVSAELGIPEPKISKYDRNFEKERERKMHGHDAEPGNGPGSPYRAAHRAATKVEKFVAKHLGRDWASYGKAVDGVSATWNKDLHFLRRKL